MGQVVSVFWIGALSRIVPAWANHVALTTSLLVAAVTYYVIKRFQPNRIPFLPKAPIYTKGFLGLLLADQADLMSPQFSHGYMSSHMKTAQENGWKVWQDRRILDSEIIITDMQDLRHIFTSQNYHKMPQSPAFKHVGGSSYLVNVHSPQQHSRERREFLTALSPVMISRMVNLVVPRHGTRLIENLKAQGAVVPSLFATIQPILLSIMAELCLGPMDDAGFSLMASTAQIVADNMLLALRFVGVNDILIGPNRRLRDGRKAVLEYVQKNGEHIVRAATREGHPVSLMASYVTNPAIAADQKRLTDLIVLLLLVAGEATSLVLAWSLIDLSRSPRAQERLANELRGAFDLNACPDTTRLRDCPYLTHCLKESCRLHLPGGIIQRWAAHDDVLPGTRTFVPAGTPILPSHSVINQNAAVHGADALEFVPERWEDPAYAAGEGQDHMQSTFGYGEWGCPGRELGKEVAKVLMAMIIRNMKLEWHADQPPPTIKAEGFAVPAHALKMNVSLRSC